MKRKLCGVLTVGFVVMSLVFTFRIDASVIKNGPTCILNKCFVDSNQWTFIASTYSSDKEDEAYIRITDIYKADGSDSNYKKIKYGVCYKSDMFSSGTIKKGTKYYFDIPSDCIGRGRKYVFLGMGNNPSKDCLITGFYRVE